MNEEVLKEADIQKRMCQAVYPLGVLLIEKECKLEQKKEELDYWTISNFEEYSKGELIFFLRERIKQLQKEIHSHPEDKTDGNILACQRSSGSDTKEIREEKQDENS